MLKLFEFRAGETDWVAARSQDQAILVLCDEYGIDFNDLDCTEISEVKDTDQVIVHTDVVDVESEDMLTRTATEVMADMKSPGVICSTAW